MPATLSTLRLADSTTAERYPLPVEGPAPWRQTGSVCQLSLPLPEIGPGTLLVPSLATMDEDAAGHAVNHTARHQWTLRAGNAAWTLNEVPCRSAPTPVPHGSAVSTHIDCYHVHRPLQGSELHLTVEGSAVPARYLVCVSARPVTIADPRLPRAQAALPGAPAPRSQTTAPEAIASRICSPTCVSMVLDLHGRPHDWLALAGECHDPVSGMYGVWPLAVAAAARRGCLGAVEVFPEWRDPLTVLDHGVPLVTSIRFSAGELPDAPLDETGGHLVVVYAASPDEVQVCDPAAAPEEVLRAYPADAFSRAWLRHRGAAYILPP